MFRWTVPAAAFVAFQLAFAATMALSLGFYAAPPLYKYGVLTSALFTLCAGSFVVWHLRHRPASPLGHLRTLDWSPIRDLAVGMVLLWLQFVALTWMKAMLPLVGPLWADPMLADFEAAIFGDDVWRLLPGPNRLLIWAYHFWPIALEATFIYAIVKKRHAECLALILIIGSLGSFAQYLLPSGGPIFWERLIGDGRFADMGLPPKVTLIADYLWFHYLAHSAEIGAGISAFPSIHVATAAWIAMTLRNAGGYIFFGLIFAGSVILGWHWLIDGVAGSVGAVFCFYIAGRLTEPSTARVPLPAFALNRIGGR